MKVTKENVSEELAEKERKEMLRLNFNEAYLRWTHVSHTLMPVQHIMSMWDRYVIARDAWFNFVE